MSLTSWRNLILSVVTFATMAVGQTPKTGVSDVLRPAQPGTVQIKGWLGHKVDLCIANRVMAQDVDQLVQPFRVREEGDIGGWRCDFWGRWFTSAALGYTYQPTPEHRAVLDKAVRGLLETQTPDGYIGTYRPSVQLGGWDIWGRMRVLLGLLAYYDATGDRAALDAARREADHFRSQVGPGKVNLGETGFPQFLGLPSTSILEPIALLYERTGSQDYLDLARYIVGQWETPNKLTPTGIHLIEDALAGKPVVKIAFPKAYEMTSNYEGLCELYRATGNRQYLAAALKVGESIRQTERMIIGSGSNHEYWCEGARYQTEVLEEPIETCVTATWMKFCYQLLRLTGDPVWADELEVSLYNALLGGMTLEGRWWAYWNPLTGERVPSPTQYPDISLTCCVASGPRGLLLTPRWAVMTEDDGAVVNLYAPGSATVQLKDGTEVKILQETDYPVNDQVRLTLQPSQKRWFALRLRIPAWSRNTLLSVNGQAVACQAGTYAKLEREWTAGDSVVLKLDLRGRAVPAPSGAPQLAVMRGPIVLALDNRLVQPQDEEVYLVADANGYVELRPQADKPNDVWMSFEVPFRTAHPFSSSVQKPPKIAMCDFASAGNAWTESNLYRVWLPQPLYLRQAYAPDTWKLMWPTYPDSKSRPEIPKF
jgi:DUF1680 family protein